MYSISTEYLTGVAVLDEQHSHLFRLTDQAQTLLKDQNMLYKFDDLEQILKEIRSYTLSHFDEEEKYMTSSSYTRFEEHRKLHEKFIENLTQIDQEAANISLGTQDSILSELLKYLTEWLQQHILIIDKQMINEIEADK